MTATSKPRVTIGMPVYNGERFIRATLDSILAQTYCDFELVICDNASTDATERICKEYAARDPRVRYHRNERNIWPAPNYNRCVDLARGELFKWSAADDLIAPTFLARCVEELDKDATAQAVYASTKEIDEQGRELFDHEYEIDLSSRRVSARLWKYSFTSHRKNRATELWGVYRTATLRQWSPIKGSFPSADRLVIVRTALRGPMLMLRERLFLNRSHGNRSQTYLDRAKVRPGSRLVRWVGCGPLPSYEWWDSTKKGKIVFPEWKWWWEHVRAVHEAPLSAKTKLACYGVTACLFVNFVPRLARDLLIAGELLCYRLLGVTPKPPQPQPAQTSVAAAR